MAKRKSVKPIPVRFTDETKDGIKSLEEQTGADASDIIRRLVDFSLGVVRTTGRVDFLFDKALSGRTQAIVGRASADATGEKLTPKGSFAAPSKSRKASASALADLKEKHGG